MYQDRPVFSSFSQGNCVFHIGFSESVLSWCQMAEWESAPCPRATANQITWMAEPYWPISFSFLGFKNSKIFLICELDIENWGVTCSWGRWCDAHPRSKMTGWRPQDGDNGCWASESFCIPATFLAFGCWEVHRNMPDLSSKCPFTHSDLIVYFLQGRALYTLNSS